jgi:hypothetical protein
MLEIHPLPLRALVVADSCFAVSEIITLVWCLGVGIFSDVHWKSFTNTRMIPALSCYSHASRGVPTMPCARCHLMGRGGGRRRQRNLGVTGPGCDMSLFGLSTSGSFFLICFSRPQERALCTRLCWRGGGKKNWTL